MANAAALLRTLAYIEEHPENWNQEEWAVRNPGKKWVPDNICGTAFCFAGNALVQEADMVPWFGRVSPGQVLGYRVSGWDFIPRELARAIAQAVKDGDYSPDKFEAQINQQAEDCESYARELLDLEYAEAERLFSESNTLQDLRDIIFEFISDDYVSPDAEDY